MGQPAAVQELVAEKRVDLAGGVVERASLTGQALVLDADIRVCDCSRGTECSGGGDQSNAKNLGGGLKHIDVSALVGLRSECVAEFKPAVFWGTDSTREDRSTQNGRTFGRLLPALGRTFGKTDDRVVRSR